MAEIIRTNLGLSSGRLLQFFRDGEPHTKAELANLTGLARSTVSLRLDPLLALGIIGPMTDATSTGGRPSARLHLKDDAFVVGAVSFGATSGSRIRHWTDDT